MRDRWQAATKQVGGAFPDGASVPENTHARDSTSARVRDGAMLALATYHYLRHIPDRGYRARVEILLRHDPESIATACIQPLTDSVMRMPVACAARWRVEQLYGRKTIVASIRAIIESAIASDKDHREVADGSYQPETHPRPSSNTTSSAETT